jgi:succinate dehydrogenase / fumarate reductase flavoprotein subunit
MALTDKIPVRRFDALIIGAGGAGLKAALQLSNANMKVAVISKVFPTRSHTVAAQGGVNAALANVNEDNWHWHMFDTVKGSDYLGDQDAIEYMCRAAPQVVYELEHAGVPFSRLENGTIYQRKFGGQSQNFGGAQAARTCAAADRTGHAILQTLYQQNLRNKTHFFTEYFAVDLLRNDEGQVLGALAFSIETGESLIIDARTTLLATGGVGQLFKTCTNALINTGDGIAMAMRAGVPAQDMEFFQFHPTGIAGKGMLISEAVRGEGGILLNSEGERFMERYAPSAKDLASRDVVSRAVATEIREGRGCGKNKDHVWLSLDNVDAEVVKKRLPGIRDLCLTFLGIDPAKQHIPVTPTAHYTMGGIPANRRGEVIMPAAPLDRLDTQAENSQTVVTGLYAAGECACVSVHGANRLGGNSLLDILVFGRAAANSMIDYLQENRYHKKIPAALIDKAAARLQRWDQADHSAKNTESVAQLRDELRKVMEDHCSVFRTETVLQQGIEKLNNVIARIQKAQLHDHSKIFNTARVEALELENLAECAMATIISALQRQESRGAHSRMDYPDRDDQQYLKHSLYFKGDRHAEYKPVRSKPMTVDSFPPKKRVY